MEEPAETKSVLNTQQLSTQEQSSIIAKMIKNNYERVGKVKVTFHFEEVAVANQDKIALYYDADQLLMDVKKELDSKLKNDFFFYLNQSFMPSLNAKIGDLVKCYGKYDATIPGYSIKFTGCPRLQKYG